ncbi:hypothetical protein BH11PAT1_BH11PAT1_2240 [soil metagenome]
MFLILAVIFALGIAYFATQNTAGVSIYIAQYFIPGVPLYMVMVVSLLVGMFMAWVAGLLDNIGSMFAIRGKDSRIRQTQLSVNRLEEKVHELEVENARLRGETQTEKAVHNSTVVEDVQGGSHPIHHNNPFFPNLRSMFR